MTTQATLAFIVHSITELRTLRNDPHQNNLVSLTGLTGASDGHGHGGIFIYNPANVLADNGTTVIVPTGDTSGGAYVRLSKYQDTIRFDQTGALAAGSFLRLVSRGGYYASFAAILGTAGSVASTVTVAVNGTTVATITFAIGATLGTIAYTTGTNFVAANGATLKFTVVAGTGAADLSLVLDV